MASAIYPLFKEYNLLNNGTNYPIDLDGDTIKARLVNITTDYTYSAAHNYLDDVTAYSGTTDQTISFTSCTTGCYKGGNVTFSAVAIDGSKTVGGVVIYKYNATPASAPLIAYIEFTAVTPNGGDITISWNASGIFQL